MGMEVTCKADYRKKTIEVKAWLEGDHVLVRGSGEVKLKIAFADLRKVTTSEGQLTLEFEGGGPLTLHLGEPAADKWAQKIMHPPTRLDKLGIKPGSKVFLDGLFEEQFTRETAALLASAKQSDLLFLAAEDASGLKRIASIAKQLQPKAALWVVYPKGKSAPVKQEEVFASAHAAGLVDSKVCGFSATHTALKFVIPVAKRPK
jgi:hypothetical protein